MRKLFFFIFCLAVTMFAVQSCKNQPFELVYDVQVTGDADGKVEVTFPDGSLHLDGSAGIAFLYGNDTKPEKVFTGASTPLFQEARVFAEGEAATAFSAHSESGTYYLHVTGYVKESLTGVRVEIDKVLTNRE